jgi:hypothetical protein
MSAIYKLDAKVSAWWSKLPGYYRLTAVNISAISKDILPKLVLINTVYHQSLTALHASVVPLFSWSTDDEFWPSSQRLSAIIAYEHACEASTLFETVLTRMEDVSSMPSFIAYAAYCGCAVQIPFMWCLEPSVRERAQHNVKTNARTIHCFAKYWKFSALLVSITGYN